MLDKKVRVLSSIFAGNKVWEVGIYPNEEKPNADILFRIAEQFEAKGVPLKDRTVVLCGESAKKITENPFDNNININNNPNNENGGEPLKNASNNNGDNDGNGDDESENDESYITVEEFSKLKAKEQKEYVQSLYENDDVDYDTFYQLASDYMQVAEAKTVIDFINKCFAEMEENE